MKKISIILLISFICLNWAYVIAQSPNNRNCQGGNQQPLPTPVPQAGLGDQASMALIIRTSVDPNELEGPMGVDSVRWVSKNDVLNYTVFFENDPVFATAHAQEVDIRIDMPDARLLNDFKLGTYTFANRAFEMPNEPNFYSMRLDCRDSLDVYVDVVAGMDMEKNQTFWHFSSIDPESGHAPWQVDRGMLPVNDSTHVGEGFVTFRLKPHEEMATGDTISFFANIRFDSNDTIPTNRWCNKIDAGAPTSRVIATVDQENYSHYLLSFEAEDDRGGSGMNRVFLYLADNLGNYEEYAACPVDSVLDFYVEKGKQYNFMTIGEDRVGNRENIKTKPDLVLNFNEPPTDLLLSNSVFQDDIALDGFIGELSTVDTEGESEFTYALAEGEGAIHNDMFAVVGNRLQANDCFKCSDINKYNIRLSTTDAGGLTYSKAFQLDLKRVLEEPEPQTLDVEICEGDEYEFHGETYTQTGTYTARVENEFMCDSVYTLNLRVNPIPEPPTITVSGKSTLISSAETGNQWYKDGEIIDGATEKQYTAPETGLYSVTASNGRCESNPSAECFVNLDVASEFVIDLGQGWSWFSSNTDDASIKQPNTFFASVLNNLSDVYGATGELANSNGVLSGTLSSIEPATYKAKMSASGQIKLNANPIEPDSYPINLHAGWNWIPYLPVVDLVVDAAFSNFTPQENDVIKSQTQFATFANGKWNGSLKEMHPNGGYMYYTTQPSTMTYSSSRAMIVNGAASYAETNPAWDVDASAYPDNMTIVAKLFNGDTETIEGAYTVGAFCNDECRGIGQYENGLLYITIHGQDNNSITFKAIENATDTDFKIKESLTFTDTPIGTVSNPYRLTLDINSGINDVYSDYDLTIYPNPVRDRMFIEGDVTDVTGVKVISTNGVTLISVKDYEHGVDVTSISDGVYIAAILTSHGVVYRKFIKKGY